MTFSTYNFSKLEKLAVTLDSVELVIVSRKYKLEVNIKRDTGVELASPVSGFMTGKRLESMSSRIQVKITDQISKKIIFNEMGENAGLDISGDIKTIETNSKKRN